MDVAVSSWGRRGGGRRNHRHIRREEAGSEGCTRGRARCRSRLDLGGYDRWGLESDRRPCTRIRNAYAYFSDHRPSADRNAGPDVHTCPGDCDAYALPCLRYGRSHHTHTGPCTCGAPGSDAHANTHHHTYPDPDPDRHTYSYADALAYQDGDSYEHANAYRHTDEHTYADEHTDAYGHTDGYSHTNIDANAYEHTHSAYSHANSHSYGHGDPHSYADCYPHTHTDPYAGTPASNHHHYDRQRS